MNCLCKENNLDNAESYKIFCENLCENDKEKPKIYFGEIICDMNYNMIKSYKRIQIKRQKSKLLMTEEEMGFKLFRKWIKWMFIKAQGE